MKEQPRVVLSVAHSVCRKVSRFVRAIDFVLDWEMLDAGKILFEQGAQAENLFVVLSGRLRCGFGVVFTCLYVFGRLPYRSSASLFTAARM